VSVLLDTTVLIDHLRGVPHAGNYIGGLGAPPSCSEVSRVEVLQGARPAERRRIERLFALVAWIPVEEKVSRRAGELGQRWLRSHPGIGVTDLLIAASADLLEIPLATNNLKHFPMFQGLRAPY